MRLNDFKIIIPVYNSEQWIEKCINSVSCQNYKNWKAIIVNDSSTDNTLQVIKNTLKQNNNKSNFSVFSRNINVGALENTIYATNKICNYDDDIIVMVDGDDWLIDENVLTYLNEIYQNNDIWLTYGSYNNLSTNPGTINRLITDTTTYRKQQSYCTSHLRTYRFKIYKKILDRDLRDINGNYYKTAGDVAVMYPLIEMCGIKRIKYIEKPLYIYNDLNPINDHKKNVVLQLNVLVELKNKYNYGEL